MFAGSQFEFQRRQAEMRRKLEARQAAVLLFAHANSQMKQHAMGLYRRGMTATYEDAERLARQTLGPQTAKVLQDQLRSMGAGPDVIVTCP